jgi:phosphatidylinositol kinase/protein kinase (PI-3  family)
LAAGGVKAAFSEKPLSKWLRKQNPMDDAHERAVENLVRSCAASCIATYVLGVW